MKKELESCFQFRKIAPQDIPHLVKIDQVSNRPPWTKKMFERELELPFSFGLICQFQEEPIAFGILWLVNGTETAQIVQLAVAPNYRGKGIGKELLKGLIDFSQKHACKKIELELREDNIPAKKLYEKLGFKIVGERKNFYDDCDGVLMECSLS